MTDQTDRILPVSAHPTADEISRRLKALQSSIREQGLDAYLCFCPDNIFYLTNFANFVHERPFILIIPVKGLPVFLMPKLEAPHVRTRAVGALEFVHYFEFPAPKTMGWSDRLREILSPGQRVGIETHCPLAVAEAVPGTARAVDLVDELRLVKSPYEIGRIAYTCDLVSRAHAMLLAGARPGRMPVELHSKATAAVTKRMLLDCPNANMLNTKFAAIAQPPEVSHDPHNFTDVFMKFTQGGPHVSISSGTANGYGAEVERTFFLNRVPEKARQPFEDMLAARRLAFDLTVPGNIMSEVDRKVNEFLTSKGYGPHLLHRTGHGFGVTNHEAPFLAEGYDREIRPNMVFSIEPGIYIQGLGGFRFSDTILVTETGNMTLTSAPETLEALTIDARPSLADKTKALALALMTRKNRTV
ncbi:MAG: aminopeptidase P family protein [Desulfobacter sp.]|nr:MAG: aminopeptidase P family protein [Desulfobacter sp.]